MRRSYLWAFAALACTAFVAIGQSIALGITRLFEIAFPPEAPQFAFAGGFETPRILSALTFGDPHADRHEAGQSRRAAARGI
jgi:hypothetical protein